MRIDTRPDPAQYDRTVCAFLIAPGIAAMVGAVSFCIMEGHGHAGGLGLVMLANLLFAAVAYPTTLFIAVPLYLVLPERGRRGFAVIPLAGAIAAAPWSVEALAVHGVHGGVDMRWLALAFACGCVGGIAFLLLRRRPGLPFRGDRFREDAARGAPDPQPPG